MRAPDFDIFALPTPYYIVDERRLIENLEILRQVAASAGCKILLAQKAFSMYHFYPLIGRYLSGTAASGLYEARLGFEEMGGETHAFSVAYADGDFDEIAALCGHIVFNSFAQWERFKNRALGKASCGLRVNPECSTQEHPAYDPCAPGSRLGVTAAHFRSDRIEGLEGLHFHTLCEQDAGALEITLAAVEERFGEALKSMRWLNMGGGHHITRPDYDREKLISLVRRMKASYGIELYLEPGEAVALNAGYLVATVLDLVENGICTAILDASAACHMPDVLEMPYRPEIYGAGKPHEKPFTYRLGGPTCLAGDIIGDYSFDKPLSLGDRLVFGDMAHYSMVKNNTFNGMPLPTIAKVDGAGNASAIKCFGYRDFKGRLS
jgi:carboxynorspermidine decarboxylase